MRCGLRVFFVYKYFFLVFVFDMIISMFYFILFIFSLGFLLQLIWGFFMFYFIKIGI